MLSKPWGLRTFRPAKAYFFTVVLQFQGPVSDMPNLLNEFTAEFTPDASRTALN